MNPIRKEYSIELLKEIMECIENHRWFHAIIVCKSREEAFKIFYDDVPQFIKRSFIEAKIQYDIGFADLWFGNHSSLRIVTQSPHLPPFRINALLWCNGVNQEYLDSYDSYWLSPYKED